MEEREERGERRWKKVGKRKGRGEGRQEGEGGKGGAGKNPLETQGFQHVSMYTAHT